MQSLFNLNSFFSNLFSDMPGEPVTIGDGLLYSLFGFLLVICVLMALMGLIFIVFRMDIQRRNETQSPDLVWG